MELLIGNRMIEFYLVSYMLTYMNLLITFLIVALVVAIVGIDLLFFRNLFWERLMVNVGIVLIFGAFYLRFLHHS